MNHIPPYLFLSREDEDDVRDIGKHDFRLVLLYPMLSNANRTEKHFLLLRLLLSKTGVNIMTTRMAIKFKVNLEDIFRIAWTRISNRNQRCCFVTQSKIFSLELRDKTRAFEGTTRIQLRAILF